MKEFFLKLAYIIQGWSSMIVDLILGRQDKVFYMRYKTCKQCKYMKFYICTLCKCVIEAKVKVNYYLDENGKSIGGCPLKKW